ncbi:MAG: hypothetical protein U0974_11885 [Gemmatimonadales bacterium]|nr:hypothetical protein [Gemmatimonadales bacterium]
MKAFVLEMSDGPKICFDGKILAKVVSSGDPKEESRFSGLVGRRTELALYKTQEGTFICHRTSLQGTRSQRSKFEGGAYRDLKQVMDFFGHGWLARELYAKASIDDTMRVP